MSDFARIFAIFSLTFALGEAQDLAFQDACFCQCRPDYTVFNENTNKTEGNCQDELRGRRWCYITPECAKHCGDSQWWEPANSHWSFDACYTPVLTEPPCDVEHVTCTLTNADDYKQVYLACFQSRHEEIGLDLDCNDRIRNPYYGPMRPCKCDQFPERFLNDKTKSVGCVAPANSDRLDTTTSSSGLGGVKVRRTWKARRQCKWKFFANENKWKCIKN